MISTQRQILEKVGAPLQLQGSVCLWRLRIDSSFDFGSFKSGSEMNLPGKVDDWECCEHPQVSCVVAKYFLMQMQK